MKVIGATSKRVGTEKVSILARTKTLQITSKPAPTVQANRALTITVRGLGKKESVTVDFRGHRISPKGATANANGVYRVTTPAGWSWGYKTVHATGVTKHRAGTAQVDVERRY